MALMNVIEIENNNNIVFKYLDRIDIIGYACARNSKTFTKELDEFSDFKKNLLEKYGHKELNENGIETGVVTIDETDAKYEDAMSEYKKVLYLDRNIDIIKIKYTDVIGLLSGNEILQLDWMLED